VTNSEHPFARFVRILGKGKSGSRSLTFEEAREAFGLILAGEVEAVQLGAFLMLLRVNEETADELAGFATACRDHIGEAEFGHSVDLDWPSYAGKKAQQPWYLLSALLLAANGVRILMHGSDGHTAGRVYSESCLQGLGVASCTNLQQASQQITQSGFAYLPLRQFCHPLHEVIQLKPVLGLRSPVNTLVRLINPLRATHSVQSVFHPAYGDLHAGADKLMQQPNSLVFKGEGGEVEIKPNANTRCLLLRDGALSEFNWPRSLTDKPEPATDLGADALLSVWQGQRQDPYGEQAIVETCACILLLLRRAADIEQARELATRWWQQRQKDSLPVCP
jgi:anthranilate phosphoribosyltransferase